MKKIILLILLWVAGENLYAQVEVSSNLSSAKATLHVTGSPDNTVVPDGILPPRLTRAQLISKVGYGLEHAGVFVYVTDLSGSVLGSTINVTKAGLYYFDGTFWQYLEAYDSDSSDLSSSGNVLTSKVAGIYDTTEIVSTVAATNTVNTLVTTVNGESSDEATIVHSNNLVGSGNTVYSAVNGIASNLVTLPNMFLHSKTLIANRVVGMGTNTLAFAGSNLFSVDGSTFLVNTETNRVGFGAITPVANADARSLAGNTSIPGLGYIGIGNTSVNASEAGAGAVRYSTASGGTIQYSDGANWSYLESDVEKSIVIAKKNSAQTIAMTVDPVMITNWVEIEDINGDFNPTTGEFTAPRDGNYIISFVYNFTYSSINGGTQVEAILYSPLGTSYFKKSVISFPVSGSSEAGAAITFGVRMNAGEVYRPSVWHNTGSSKSLRVGSGNNDGYVSFSVREL